MMQPMFTSEAPQQQQTDIPAKQQAAKSHRCGAIENSLVHYWIWLHVVLLSLFIYRWPCKAWKVFRLMMKYRQVLGNALHPRFIKRGRKYFFQLYIPGFPSRAFNRYIRGEFNRISPVKGADKLNAVFFAITNKCALHCEHCFEWENLNKKETFTRSELVAILGYLQNSGVSQIYFTGGEPMMRLRDLLQLTRAGGSKSEYYVLSSGFHFTNAAVSAMKRAGIIGVVVSLDHYDEYLHNRFRGNNNSFNNALTAIIRSAHNSLLVATSICLTKQFINKENLHRYMQLAADLGVDFVQWLEPKSTGQYSGKDVLLNKDQIALLEAFYLEAGSNPGYKHYPTIIYHGYYQRRTGCASAGDRSMYIDSAGFVNACPFCHTKNTSIKQAISDNTDIQKLLAAFGCPIYQQANLPLIT